MSMKDDGTAILVFTGSDPWERDEVKDAIGKRLTAILPTLKQRGGLEVPQHLWHERYLYDGNRCKPENLGWRFVQNYGNREPAAILRGDLDAQIEATWHEAAHAEYWYAYEKDWG